MIASAANGLFLMLPMIGGSLLVYGIFQVVMDMRTANQEKVLGRLTEAAGPAKQRQVKESLLRSRQADVQKNVLEAVLTRLRLVTKLQRVLDQASINWNASRVLLNTTGAGLLVGVGLAIAGVSPVGCVGAVAATVVLPILVLLFKRGRRIKKLIEQLPDVFELMGQALRAGHSLASAIQLVSEQMPDPIAGEFALVFHEQNLGIKIEDALLNMADRVDQLDVRFFVTAVLIQRQTGGDLAEVLDKIGKVIRDRIQLFGTVKALTAEGRMSGLVLLLLPVLVFMLSLSVNPGYARMLLDTPTGRIMLGTAICMDLMGMAMIKMIVNIKV
jgi:tight adherence protein B